MRVAVRRADTAFGEAEGDEHQRGVVGEDLAGHAVAGVDFGKGHGNLGQRKSAGSQRERPGM
jgi:hypothetical protein